VFKFGEGLSYSTFSSTLKVRPTPPLG
jgi:hypothetical protein